MRRGSGNSRAPALHLPRTGRCMLGTWQDAKGAQLRTLAEKFGGGRRGCRTEREEEETGKPASYPEGKCYKPHANLDHRGGA